jgi:hypothetical protein
MKNVTAILATLSRVRNGWLSIGLLLMVCISSRASARVPVALAVPHTTVVVLADLPLPPREWPALFAAIRRNLVNAGAEGRAIDPHPDLLRGDEVVSGMRVDLSISVYLHGKCEPELQPHRYPAGQKLGWVMSAQGHIDPFVHVDCTRVGQVLQPAIFWWNAEQRLDAMADAIARVILHEWIHIATQNPAHGRHGVNKAQFGVDDLISIRGQLVARMFGPRKTNGKSGE